MLWNCETGDNLKNIVPWATRINYLKLLKDGVKLKSTMETLIKKQKSLGHMKRRQQPLENMLMIGKLKAIENRPQKTKWFNATIGEINKHFQEHKETATDRLSCWNVLLS